MLDRQNPYSHLFPIWEIEAQVLQNPYSHLNPVWVLPVAVKIALMAHRLSRRIRMIVGYPKMAAALQQVPPVAVPVAVPVVVPVVVPLSVFPESRDR